MHWLLENRYAVVIAVTVMLCVSASVYYTYYIHGREFWSAVFGALVFIAIGLALVVFKKTRESRDDS